MITLNQQTEQQLQEIATQTQLTVQQLIDRFIDDYQDEQQSIKRADASYAEFLNSSESLSLYQIKEHGLHRFFK
jgi:predicted DNA-binding ribbon-helix-helix protein